MFQPRQGNPLPRYEPVPVCSLLHGQPGVMPHDAPNLMLGRRRSPDPATANACRSGTPGRPQQGVKPAAIHAESSALIIYIIRYRSTFAKLAQ
jgi:hypothetical protein